MCDFIVSSESKKTPRSRTTVDGDTLSGPTLRCWSADDSLPRFVAEPNHITLVFLVLSWRRFAAHQLLTADTQTPSLAATSLTRAGLPRPVPSCRRRTNDAECHAAGKSLWHLRRKWQSTSDQEMIPVVWCVYQELTDRWRGCTCDNLLCSIGKIGGEPLKSGIAGTEASLKDVEHDAMVSVIECSRHIH